MWETACRAWLGGAGTLPCDTSMGATMHLSDLNGTLQPRDAHVEQLFKKSFRPGTWLGHKVLALARMST